MMWHDIDPYDWLNKMYKFHIVAIVIIISRHSLRSEMHHINQSNHITQCLMSYYFGIAIYLTNILLTSLMNQNHSSTYSSS